jgi:hypothetical protein
MEAGMKRIIAILTIASLFLAAGCAAELEVDDASTAPAPAASAG